MNKDYTQEAREYLENSNLFGHARHGHYIEILSNFAQQQVQKALNEITNNQ